MKNYKTIIIIAVLVLLAYLEDPTIFSMQDEVNDNPQNMQANLNPYQKNQKNKSLPKKASFFETIGFKKAKNNSGSGSQMTIVKCMQPTDKILASAFMLPPNWQVQCNTQYKIEMNTLSSDSLYQAQSPSKDIRLFNEPSRSFFYDQQMLQQLLKTMYVPGVDESMLQESGYNTYMQQQRANFENLYPKALDLVQFAQQTLPEFIRKEGFQVYHISKDPIERTLTDIFRKEISSLPNVSDIDVNAVTVIARSQNDPNEIKMMKTIQIILYMGRHDKYAWTLLSFSASGKERYADKMSKLIDMVINTKQDNPKFTQMLAKVNSQLLKQKIAEVAKTSQIRYKANQEINDMLMSAYNNRQASSDRLQSKWVDSNWEVENYRDPFSGKQVKLPSSNKYYFTNNLDDYIGTNNPLLDPNVDLNYLYNWQKLERDRS